MKALRRSKIPRNSVYNLNYEKVVKEDLDQVRKKENDIIDFNDELVALNRVVTNQENEIAILQNQIRLLKIEYYKKKDGLDERKAKVTELSPKYQIEMENYEKSIDFKNKQLDKIRKLRSSIEELLEKMKIIFSMRIEDDTNLRKLRDFHKTEVERLSQTVSLRKQNIEDQNRLKVEKEAKQVELEDLTKQYNKKREELLEHIKKIDKRDEAASKILALPCDSMQNEEDYVEDIEKQMHNMETILTENTLDSSREDVQFADTELKQMEQENTQRRSTLRAKRESLLKSKMSSSNRSVGTLSTITATKYRVASTVANYRPESVRKLASNVIKDLFAKMEQREEGISLIDNLTNQIAEQNIQSRPQIEEEYNEKMAKVEELTKQVSEIDSIQFEISKIQNEIIELKRREATSNLELERMKRSVVTYESAKQRNSQRQEEIARHKESIEAKTKELNEASESIKERRSKLGVEFSAYNVEEEHAKTTEQSVLALEHEVQEQSNKLDELVKESNVLLALLGKSDEQ